MSVLRIDIPNSSNEALSRRVRRLGQHMNAPLIDIRKHTLFPKPSRIFTSASPSYPLFVLDVSHKSPSAPKDAVLSKTKHLRQPEYYLKVEAGDFDRVPSCVQGLDGCERLES